MTGASAASDQFGIRVQSILARNSCTIGGFVPM